MVEAQNRLLGDTQKSEKEEFPNILENKLTGNSFPQSCVVSLSVWRNSTTSARVQKDSGSK
jgi:hypothetical protein